MLVGNSLNVLEASQEGTKQENKKSSEQVYLPGSSVGTPSVMWALGCTGSCWGAGSGEELAAGEPDMLCFGNEGQPVRTDSCKPLCDLCGKSGFTCRHYKDAWFVIFF